MLKNSDGRLAETKHQQKQGIVQKYCIFLAWENIKYCLLILAFRFSLFSVRCYTMETAKCCECFAVVNPHHGDGIYCEK